MKFFHLADLHLGKCIHGYSMIEMGDQPFWIEQLIKKAEELKPDAILIAGDIYDRAVPSKEAVLLFDSLLTRLAKMQIPVLMIAGNHDSGSRLAFGDKILCHQGIYIAGEAKEKISCVTLEDAYGPVRFWMIPYIFPAAVNVLLSREDLKDYDQAMRALLEKQNIDFDERNVVLSHQFVVASGEKPVMGGSETTVGGIGQIDTAVFDGFDYVALGHIHNMQRMGKVHVRYAGSPLCYHFSEAGQKKGLTVVELNEKGDIKITLEELQVLHKMREVSGTLEEIMQTEEDEENYYIRAVLKQQYLPSEAIDTLRAYFEQRQCVLMEVVRDFSAGKSKDKKEAKDIRKMSLEELFSEFYSYQNNGEFPNESLSSLISFTAEQTRNGHADDTEKQKQQDMKKLISYAATCDHKGECS